MKSVDWRQQADEHWSDQGGEAKVVHDGED